MYFKMTICILLVMSCATPDNINSYVLDTSCDMSIVDGELNGHKTYFLLDTGAGITSFDLSQGKQYGFTAADSDEEIGGFTNDKTKAKIAIGIHSIKVNGMEIHDGVIYTNKMDNLVMFISSCSHKTISGIIGAPLIKKYGLVIDLMNNRLIKVN